MGKVTRKTGFGIYNFGGECGGGGGLLMALKYTIT
jgi:hypothetical protein